MDEGAQRRMLIALARAEEELVETHVQNALEVVEAVGPSLPISRVLELYLEALEPDEARATIVAKRALARLEREEMQRSRKRVRRRPPDGE